MQTDAVATLCSARGRKLWRVPNPQGNAQPVTSACNTLAKTSQTICTRKAEKTRNNLQTAGNYSHRKKLGSKTDDGKKAPHPSF